MPIWIDFMRAAIAQPERKTEAFLRPASEPKKMLARKFAAVALRHMGDAEAH